jgi:hypothetical protein
MKTNSSNNQSRISTTVKQALCLLLILSGTTSPVRALDEPTVLLTNVSVEEGKTATFAAQVEATSPVSYQWFRNREPIAGAETPIYTLAKVTQENDVDAYSVVVSNQFGTARAEAVLSVLPGRPASVVSILRLASSNQFAVIFSGPVDSRSASKPENYELDGASVLKATMLNPQTVSLEIKSTSSPLKRSLMVKNVKDLADPPNVVNSMTEVEQNLKFWLRFEEANLANALDSSGNGFSAALKNKSMRTEAGKVGGCLHFDGSGDYASFPEGMSDFSGGMTFSVWAKPTAVKHFARFIEFGNGVLADNIIFSRGGDSGDLWFEVYNGKIGHGNVVAANAIENDVWQHFVATMDSQGNVKLYKNGSLVGEGTTGVPAVVARSNNYIGRSNWPADVDDFYEGEMDEVRIYERALSAEEVSVLAKDSP